MRIMFVLVATLAGGCLVDAPHYELPVDARPDAPAGQAAFDVGYVNRWMAGDEAINVLTSRWVRIVNMGAQPLDLSTGRIVNAVANRPDVQISAGWNPSVTTLLETGKSSGALSSVASSLIVGGGFVSEPAQTTMDDLITIEVTFPPQQWSSVDIELTIEIENARATFPVTLHEGSTGTGMTYTPEAAARAVSVPL